MANAWEDVNKIGVVLYDFTASGQFQISLTAGERVEVKKASSGWFKGKVIGREGPKSQGIFPISFVELTDDSVAGATSKEQTIEEKLSRAAAHSDVEAVKECLKQKVIKINQPVTINFTTLPALAHAVFRIDPKLDSHEEAVQLQTIGLLLEHKADPNALGTAGFRALHYAGTPKVAKALLDAKADIDAVTTTGFTALTRAAAGGALGVVRLLLEHHANTEIKTQQGQTALDMPDNSDEGKQCKELIRAHIAQKNKASQSTTKSPDEWTQKLCQAAAETDVATLKECLRQKGIDVNKSMQYGRSFSFPALTHAVGRAFSADSPEETAQLQIIRALLEHKADPNTRGEQGRCALHLCASPKAATGLLNAKANVDAVNDSDGSPALTIATEDGRPEVVRVLLEHGANTEIKNKHGKTASTIQCGMFADSEKHKLCKELIRAHIASKAERDKAEQLRRRERELDERERKLKEAEHKAKQDELEKLKRLEAEVAKLSVPEVAASELTMVSKRDQPLGQGGFKRALLCEWKGLSVVKLEFLAPAITDALKAFTVEFEKLHALRHGNVLRLMARVKDEMALITEYCERGSLHEVLHGKSAEKEKEQEKPKAIMVAECPLPLERAWSILLQLADAMLFLHSQPQPIVHRDVKSGNCLVTTAWTLKLADFDMARTQLATIGFSTKTQTLGTFNFKSPEQFAGAASAEKITVKSDIYAFGGVMIDVLTGRAPFTDCLPADIFTHVALLKQPPPELKLLSAFPSAALFTAKCLSQDPAARPTAAEAVAFCKAQLAEAETKSKSDAGLRAYLRDEFIAVHEQFAMRDHGPALLPVDDLLLPSAPISTTEERKEKPPTSTPTATASTTPTTASAGVSQKPVASWSVADVCAWLTAPPVSLAKHAPKFEEKGVDGGLLLELSAADLRDDLGVISGLEQKKIMLAIEKLKKT